MITSVHIDGFKSLKNLRIDLKPGLNILVGPNGAGKTNIVNYFQFLSMIITHDLSDAVSHLGGAGSIFRKIGEDEFQMDLSSVIIGCAPQRFGRRKKSGGFISYYYEFTISISSQRDEIYFSRQRLFLKTLPNYNDAQRLTRELISKPKSKSITKITDWHLGVSHSVDKNLTPRVSLLTINWARLNFPFFSQPRKTPAQVERLKFLFHGRRLMSNSIFSRFTRELEELQTVARDIELGNSFNINPDRARQGEDIARTPIIDNDGSGLAATLYMLKMGSEGASIRRRSVVGPAMYLSYPYRTVFESSLFSQIKRYLQVANENIKDLTVEYSTFDNVLNIKIHLLQPEGTTVLPVSAMSDGTIKWLALVTAIKTSPRILAIEEPENYLHPAMQREIVKIIREELSLKTYDTFVLMTTHSQALLNEAKPQELLIVSMRNGITNVGRPVNQEQVMKEINRTGFGLGYYYVTGALDDA